MLHARRWISMGTVLFALAAAGTPLWAASPCGDEKAHQFDFWVGTWSVTADGKVKNCMFDGGEVNVFDALRGGAEDADVLELFAGSVRAKGAGGLLEVLPAEAYAGLRNMSRLGG